MSLTLLERWSEPAVLISLLLLIVGGITWGVQLNFTALQQTKTDATQETRIKEINKTLQSVVITQAETAILMKELTNQVGHISEEVRAHKLEAEEWKRRILINEMGRERSSP